MLVKEIKVNNTYKNTLFIKDKKEISIFFSSIIKFFNKINTVILTLQNNINIC